MTEPHEPPLRVRAALAFGRPLREGVELLRAQHVGTIVVLGCGPCHRAKQRG